jgi:murein DD-endopeptidase MepM/ murein hydrolase activator NlpD
MSSPRRLLAALLAPALLGALAASPPAPSSAAEPVPVGVWPLQPTPEVVTGFDPPDVPWGPGHRGVDLLGDPGQAVHAALAGTVTFAGTLAGRGVVVVLHGDTRTTYEPVEATVPVGRQVGRGEAIGRLQAAGSHCPPRACLHWGWLRGPTYLDPLGLVGAAPVRLLPLWRDLPLPATGPPETVAWASPYAAVLLRIEALVARSPPYARGCACW